MKHFLTLFLSTYYAGRKVGNKTLLFWQQDENISEGVFAYFLSICKPSYLSCRPLLWDLHINNFHASTVSAVNTEMNIDHRILRSSEFTTCPVACFIMNIIPYVDHEQWSYIYLDIIKKRHENKVRKCFAVTISANSTKIAATIIQVSLYSMKSKKTIVSSLE